LNPNSSDGYLHLAVMLGAAGRPEEAIPLLKRAIRLNPVLSFLYLTSLGASYSELGRVEEAIDALKQALVANPDYRVAHVLLAAIYADLGELELARREASEVLRISPQFSLEAYRQRALSQEPNRHIAALRKAGLPE
jgi:tetratricopeptide (TPR) repeat protein